MKTLHKSLLFASLALVFLGCDPATSSAGSDNGKTDDNKKTEDTNKGSESKALTGAGKVDMDKYNTVQIYVNLSDAEYNKIKISYTGREFNAVVEAPSYASCLDLDFSVNNNYQESNSEAHYNSDGDLVIGLAGDLLNYEGYFYSELTTDGADSTYCELRDYQNSDLNKSGTNNLAILVDMKGYEKSLGF